MDKIVHIVPAEETNKTSDEILEESKGVYETVVVFGFNQEGAMECVSNAGSLAFVNLMVDQFKADLVNYCFDNLGD